jgi:hypothetical protein
MVGGGDRSWAKGQVGSALELRREEQKGGDVSELAGRV